MGPVALSIAQSRRVDRIAIDELGMHSLVLMENAARGAAEVIAALAPRGYIQIVAGKGNNGGDGLAIARQLEARGFDVRIDVLSSPEELSQDARVNYEIIRRAGLSIRIWDQTKTDEETLDQWAQAWRDAGLLVDALLGTGSSLPLRGRYAQAVELMNAAQVPIVAIDLPTGLDADSGEVHGPCIRASHTCTFATTKIGFAQETAQRYLGQLHVINLGVPGCVLERIVSEQTCADGVL